METIASDPCVEAALREWQVRCHLGHGLVKGIIKAGEMRGRGKDRLREAMSVNACGMCRGAKCVSERSWCNSCGVMSWCAMEFRPPMDDAMANRHGRTGNVLLDRFQREWREQPFCDS